MRIGVITLQHETNTFISRHTTLEHFRQHLWLEEDAILSHDGFETHETGGFLHGVLHAGFTPVPLLAARALPFGMITADAWTALRGRVETLLHGAGKLDGLLLAPHGAAAAENAHDADGDWMQLARSIVGDDTPIVAVADPHGNLSAKMMSAVDAMIAYRTNPHIDQRKVGEEAADLLVRTLRGEIRPTSAAGYPKMIVSIDRQCTSEEPCKSFIHECNAAVGRSPDAIHCSWFLGFPYADVPEMGTAICVTTNDNPHLAQAIASELSESLYGQRDDFTARLTDVEAAVQQSATLPGTTCLLDMGDNVGGGSPADSTVLAQALLDANVGPAFVCVYDPDAVRICKNAGVGANIKITVGAKTDNMHGKPLTASVEVRSLHHGKFEEHKIRHGGIRHYDQGDTAIVMVTRSVTTSNQDSRGVKGSVPGLTIMLTSDRVPPFSLRQLTAFGVNPNDYQVIVAKGVNAPIAAYQEVCHQFIRVNTPGVCCADVTKLRYQHSPLGKNAANQRTTGV